MSRRSARGQLDLFRAADALKPEVSRSPDVGAAPVEAGVTRLATELSQDIYLGTSSWSFPGWQGIVYDGAASPTRLARDGLRAYANHPLLRSVGVDRTYYAPIPSDAFAEYADMVADDFRFLVKAHEWCTVARFPKHPRYGPHKGMENERFLHAGHALEHVVGPMLEGLGDKAGVLLFQFPPQDVWAMGGPVGFAERLREFLVQLPAGVVYAVEIRNPALMNDVYREAIGSTGAVHCFNAHPSMPPVEVQRRFFADIDAPATVIRWMLARHFRYEDAKQTYAPFDRIVDEDLDARSQIAGAVRTAVRQKRRAFVIVNNKAEGSAPLSVQRLAEAIVGR